MKKMLSTLFVALFVMAAASIAYAGMAGTNYNGLNTLDPSGQTILAVHSPVAPVVLSSHGQIYLDSGKIWAVNDVRNISPSKAFATGTGMKGTSKLYCFDSGSKFCAKAY